MKKNKLKIFITGARGFVGKNLVEYLSNDDKYLLFFPYHKDLELLNTDAVSEFISKNKIDIIVHCASVGGSRKTVYDVGNTDVVYRNLKIFFNLVKNMDSVKRMIFLGSGAEYDMLHYKPRMEESYFGIFVPSDAYGFSKYVCSKYIEQIENIVSLRLFAAFGKYEDYEYRFISNSILKNLFGLPICINQNVFFDFTYINDLVRIIKYFINNRPKYKFYNATSGKSIDLLRIAKKINKISAAPSKIIIKNPGLNVEYSADNSRLLKELKGFNFTPFDKALEELYFWYRDNLDKFDKQALERDEYLKYCKVKLRKCKKKKY